MTVIDYLDTSQPPDFSEEELVLLAALEKRPIAYDEDCPPLTQEAIDAYRKDWKIAV